MSNPDTEQLVEAYLNIRAERERLKAEYEAADETLKHDMSQLDAMFLTIFNDINASSIKTSRGTVIKNLKERYICNDWGGFRDFVIQNEAVDLLERRIHQSNFKTFLAEHEADGLPPGVNVLREFGVTVRRANNQE